LKKGQKISQPLPSKQSMYNVVSRPKNNRLATRQEARLKSTVLTEETLKDIRPIIEASTRKSLKRLAQAMRVAKTSA